MDNPVDRLPTTYRATRLSMHALAEHVLCPARYSVVGRIDLSPVPNGVGTPAFGPDNKVVAVERLHDATPAETNPGVFMTVRTSEGVRRGPVSTMRSAAAFAGTTPGAPTAVFTPLTALDLDAQLSVDGESLAILASWYAYGRSALDVFVAQCAEMGDEADPIKLWPEHFDLATTIANVNYGVSPGDDLIDEPYAYVGPHARPLPHADDPFWTHGFGAAKPWSAFATTEDLVGFFVKGRLLAG